MTTEELAQRYSLEARDFWEQSFKGKRGSATHIIKHQAVMRIAVQEKIIFGAPDWIHQGENGIYAMRLEAYSANNPEVVMWSIGEADRSNSHNAVEKKFPIAMCEKRAKDRVTLALLDTFLETPLEIGLSSEIESEDFDKREAEEAEEAEEYELQPLNQQDYDQRVLLFTVVNMQKKAQKEGEEGTAEIKALCHKSFGRDKPQELTPDQLKGFVQHLTEAWSLDNDHLDDCCLQASIDIKDYHYVSDVA